MLPAGQRDYSSIRLSRHALERFVERFGVEPESAGELLRRVLSRTRRLGRNPENGAIAVLAVHAERALVAIVQDSSCLTVLTWNQFVPRLVSSAGARCHASGGECSIALPSRPTPNMRKNREFQETCGSMHSSSLRSNLV